MEKITSPTLEEKQEKAAKLIALAQQGIDVSDADPRETSIEVVVTANKIYRAQGRRAVNLVQSGF